MNILVYSHSCAPSIGGAETIVLTIARCLADVRAKADLSEFEITIVTQTPAEDFDDSVLPFRVLRQPGLRQLWQAIRSSDIVHLAGPALAPLALGLPGRDPDRGSLPGDRAKQRAVDFYRREGMIQARATVSRGP